MRAIICDIDGTIADTRHRLHFIQGKPKDWISFFDAMDTDAPHTYVITLLQALSSTYPILLATGRPETHRDMTQAWLQQHSVPNSLLTMRKAGDYRSDVVVKKEMLVEIRKTYDPLLSIDDRPEVIQMWRNNDVPCLSVDNSPWFDPPKKDADTINWLDYLGKQHHDERFNSAADEIRQLRSKVLLLEASMGLGEAS